MKTGIIPHSRVSMGRAEKNAVSAVLASGHIAAGPEVAAFEREIASFTGRARGVAVSSGTAALFLALKALGVREGQEVVIPSFVCSAVFNAVTMAGATPVLADCATGEFALSPVDVRKKLGRKTAAVIVPHLFGQPADMRALVRLGVPVIEDCAQTLYAGCQGKAAGAWGAMAVCSFYATKLLAAGEGGMVLSDDAARVRTIRDIIDYDRKGDLRFRFNFKMTDLQAAAGRVQLRKLPSFIKKRRAIARRYHNALSGKPLALPGPIDGRDHIFYRYVVGSILDAGRKMQRLKARGILAARPVYRPLHTCLGLPGYPEAERAWRQSISLPIYPSLTEKEIAAVLAAIKEIL